MNYVIRHDKKFSYIEEGEGPVLILLHGLFGALSNWKEVIEHFSPRYKVVIPLLPIYEIPLLFTKDSVGYIAKFLHKFVQHKDFEKFTLIGNSLGGHVALIYILKNPEYVSRLVLTASSGLYENSFGGGFPRREDYEFIKVKVGETFYDPKHATKELVDECFEIVNNRNKLIRILALAKSAIRHNMAKELPLIKAPTCLIWGRNDTITPPEVAIEFNTLISNSELHWVDQCGHAPMMEHAETFNNLLSAWLDKNPA